MSKPRNTGNPEPTKSGLSLRLTLSEKVIVAILTLAASFLGGMTYGGAAYLRNDCDSSDSRKTSAGYQDVKPQKW